MMSLFAAAFEVDNNTLMGGIAVAILTVFGGLLTLHFSLRKYIRQSAGVTEISRMDVSPQPLMVSAAQRFASHEEHRELCARVGKLEDTVAEAVKELGREGSRRASTIHQRVDHLATEVAAVKKAVEITGNLVVEMRRDLAAKEDRR